MPSNPVGWKEAPPYTVAGDTRYADDNSEAFGEGTAGSARRRAAFFFRSTIVYLLCTFGAPHMLLTSYNPPLAKPDSTWIGLEEMLVRPAGE